MKKLIVVWLVLLATSTTVSGITRSETDPITGGIDGLVRGDGSGNVSAAEANDISRGRIIVAAHNSSVADQSLAHYVCDGLADDVQINAATASFGSTSGNVFLCAGDYNVIEPVEIYKGVILDGPCFGFGTTILAGATIQRQAGFSGTALVVHTPHDANQFGAIRYINVDGVTSVATGIYTAARDFQIIGCSISRCGKGIEISGQGDCWVDKCFIEICATYGIYIAGGDSSFITNNVFINSAYDIGMYNTVRNRVLGNRTASTPSFLWLRGNVTNNMVSSNTVYGGGNAFVYISSATAPNFAGNLFVGNIINGNAGVMDHFFWSETESGSYSNNLVADNIVYGLGGAAFYGFSDSNVPGLNVRNNVGDYVTENAGVGTIDSGQTSDVIAHGLSVTPNIINVTFTEQAIDNYGRWWVSDTNSTSFMVNVSADPNSSNLDFLWEAKRR